LTAAVLLAGCTDADWAHVMSYAPAAGPATPEESEAAAPPPVAANVPPASAVSERAQRECVEWAGERAEDAANQNFDAETAQHVRDATYADCMTWAVRLHR